LLLTDVIMPEIGGPQLAQHLLRLFPEMKVLHMPGHPNQGIAQTGNLANGVAFLDKASTRKTLKRKVEQVLENSKFPAQTNPHTAKTSQ
jgi:FixJ family two-component response regulator